MGQKMTWEEMKTTYPDEWVALADYQLAGPVEVDGSVIAHHAQKQAFYQELQKIRAQYPNIAVRYTGRLIKNPKIPLLWQITHTEPNQN